MTALYCQHSLPQQKPFDMKPSPPSPLSVHTTFTDLNLPYLTSLPPSFPLTLTGPSRAAAQPGRLPHRLHQPTAAARLQCTVQPERRRCCIWGRLCTHCGRTVWRGIPGEQQGTFFFPFRAHTVHMLCNRDLLGLLQEIHQSTPKHCSSFLAVGREQDLHCGILIKTACHYGTQLHSAPHLRFSG